MNTHTAVVVPAQTDVASQCRIYARYGSIREPLHDYRKNPDAWHCVGMMNSEGKLVCCEPHGDLVERLKECEPLYGGMTIRFSAPENEL